MDTKELYLVKAVLYKQVADDLNQSGTLPLAGVYYERHNHEHDLAKDAKFSDDAIAQVLKNITREYMKLYAEMRETSLEETTDVVCVDGALEILKFMGVKEIAFYDQAKTIISTNK